MTLYELTDELKAAQADLAGMLGNNVITEEEYDDTLASMLDQHQVKTVGVIAYIKNEEAEAALFKAEIDKLQKRLKSTSKRIEFYKCYLLAQMNKLGQTKAGEGIHTAKVRKGSKRCEITGDIDEKYLVVKTTTAPDKRAITQAIKNGETVEGAALVAGPDSLKID